MVACDNFVHVIFALCCLIISFCFALQIFLENLKKKFCQGIVELVGCVTVNTA